MLYHFQRHPFPVVAHFGHCLVLTYALPVEVVQGLLPILSLYLIKLIVDGVTAGVVSADRSEALWQVAVLIGLAGGAALLTALCQHLNHYLQEGQSQTVTDFMYNDARKFILKCSDLGVTRRESVTEHKAFIRQVTVASINLFISEFLC